MAAYASQDRRRKKDASVAIGNPQEELPDL